MSVRLFVLGILRTRDAHGYDLIETARTWGLETWTDIGISSIYHALRSMTREGLVRERAKESEGGKPERTVYRITSKGREAFASLMEELAMDARAAKDPFYLVLGFMDGLDATERRRLLEARAAGLRARLEGLGTKFRYIEAAGEGERWSLEAVRLNRSLLCSELAWLDELLTREP